MKREVKRFWVGVGLIFIGFVILFLIFILILPTIIRTDWGTRTVEKILSKEPQMRVTIGSIDVHWSGNQKITDLNIYSNDDLFFSAPKVESSASLLQIITKNAPGALTIITKPSLNLTPDQLPPVPTEIEKTKGFSLPNLGTIKVTDGLIDIAMPQGRSVNFSPVFFSLNTDSPVELELTSNTVENGTTGSLSVVGTLIEKKPLPTIDLRAEAVDLPIDGIDRLVSFFRPSMQGVLESIFGSPLNLRINAQTANNIINLAFQGNSDTFYSSIDLTTNQNLLSLTKPAQLNLTYSPELRRFFPNLPLLLNRPRIAINLDTLDVPLDDPKAATYNGNLTIDRAELEEIVIENLDVNASNDLFDARGTLSGAQLALIGPAIDVSLSKDAQDEITLSASSPQLDLPTTYFRYDEALTLEKPTTLTINPNIDQWNTVLPTEQISPFTATINSFTLPADRKNLELELKLTNPYIALYDFPLSNIVSTLTIDKGDVNLTIDSNTLSTQIEGVIKGKEHTFVIRKPIDIEAHLTPSQFASLLPEAPQLTDEALIHAAIAPFSISLTDPNFSDLNLRTDIEIDPLNLRSPYDEKIFTLKGTDCRITYDGKRSKASANFYTQATSEEESIGVITSSFTLDTPTFIAETTVKNFSTPFLHTIFGTNRFLPEALGKTLDGSFQWKSTPTDQKLSINAASELVKANLSLNLDETTVYSTGGTLDYTLTKEGLYFLKSVLSTTPWKMTRFTLDRDSHISARISKLSYLHTQPTNDTFLAKRIPLKPLNWAQFALTSSFDIDQLTIKDVKTEEMSTLSALNIDVDKQEAIAPLNFQLSASAISAGKRGAITSQGTLEPIFTPQGTIDFAQTNAHFDLSAHSLPSSFLDAFFIGTIPFSAIFGKDINLDISTQMKDLSGSFSANLTSPNSKASINSWLTNGVLRLLDPIRMEMKMTDELTSLFFKETDSSITSISSPTPITLVIDEKNFSLPLFPLNFSKAYFSFGQLDLGKIYAKNEGNISAILSFLKSTQYSRGSDLSVWFTPTTFSLYEGFLNVDRTEILIADSLEFASWGVVDLVDSYVNMVLGVPGDTLNRTLGIVNLPENYLLQIPMTGPIGDVEINTPTATAKIASIILWQNRTLTEQLQGTGPTGRIFGNILETFAGVPDINAPAPPPPQNIPWRK